jgi:predicted DNA-binding transcriptional regulator AlpA
MRKNDEETSAKRLRSRRIRAATVSSILGVSVRTIHALASRGELPSAARIGKV